MKSQIVTSVFLVVGLVAGTNGLKCWASDLENPTADPKEETVKDPTGADAAHGLCVTITAELEGQKADVWGWLGWRDEDHEQVDKCLKDSGAEAGKCLDGQFELRCDAKQVNSFSNTSLKTLMQEPTFKTCFCDKDLCNKDDGGDDGTTTPSGGGGDDGTTPSGSASVTGFASAVVFAVMLLLKMN